MVKLAGLIIFNIASVLMAEEMSVSQKSFYHGKQGCDSIVLSQRFEENQPYFGEISIHRQGNPVFHYSSDEIEFEGFDTVVYIFTQNERPEPNRYLIVSVTEDSSWIVVTTPSNTAEIFGDIDADGKFEIGGIKEYGETVQYEVLEVGTDISIDTTLTKTISALRAQKGN